MGRGYLLVVTGYKRGCYGVYVAVTGSMSCMALIGPIYEKECPCNNLHFMVWIFLYMFNIKISQSGISDSKFRDDGVRVFF